MSERKVTTRSHEFILSFQLDGVCEAMRLMISRGLDPGSVTRRVLKALRDDFVQRCSGKAIDLIPEITDNTAPDDLYVIAELLRATNLSFLSQEEREERGPLGFSCGNASAR